MSIAVDFEGPADNDLAFNIVLSDPDTSNAIIAARLSPADLAHDSPASRWELGDKVELWWPVNYGLAKQYDLRVSLVDSKVCACSYTFTSLSDDMPTSERCSRGHPIYESRLSTH